MWISTWSAFSTSWSDYMRNSLAVSVVEFSTPKAKNQLPAYPDVLKAYDYYKGKYSGRFRSYVVENVFSRRAYKQAGGFKNFDLAWGSDVATWCIFCGIKATTELEEGREIKIPKLESKQSVRKKLKQQTSAKH